MAIGGYASFFSNKALMPMLPTARLARLLFTARCALPIVFTTTWFFECFSLLERTPTRSPRTAQRLEGLCAIQEPRVKRLCIVPPHLGMRPRSSCFLSTGPNWTRGTRMETRRLAGQVGTSVLIRSCDCSVSATLKSVPAANPCERIWWEARRILLRRYRVCTLYSRGRCRLDCCSGEPCYTARGSLRGLRGRHGRQRTPSSP